MKRLRQDDAIKCIRRNMVRVGEVTDKCSIRVIAGYMKNIADFDALSTEALSIGSISNFENSSLNIVGRALKKVFNIVTIDGLPAVKAKVIAEWCQTVQVSELNCSQARSHLTAPSIKQPLAFGS